MLTGISYARQMQEKHLNDFSTSTRLVLVLACKCMCMCVCVCVLVQK